MKKTHKHSEETKQKISQSHKGKKLSEETRRKMGEAQKGHIVSEDTRRKISKKNSGKKRSAEFCKAVSETKKGNKNRLGKFHSIETRRKISISLSGKKHSLETRMKRSENQKGSNGSNWKGGITPINEIIRKSLEYKLWREAVFKRDNYTCVLCLERGERLNADHIKRFSDYPKLRFVVDNGRTLCVSCHRTTDTWGRKLTSR